MKRVFALLAVLTAATLMGCTKKSAEQPAQPPPPAAEAPAPAFVGEVAPGSESPTGQAVDPNAIQGGGTVTPATQENK